MLGLPSDLILHTSSFLPLRSKTRFFSTCKYMCWLKTKLDKSVILPLKEWRHFRQYNKMAAYAIRIQDLEMISLSLQLGAKDYALGMKEAALVGRTDLFNIFFKLAYAQAKQTKNKEILSKRNWNHIMISAARGGHEKFVHLCILNGADDWKCCLFQAVEAQHMPLILLFIDKMQGNYDYFLFDDCLKRSARLGNRDLINFFISKGSSNWQYAMEGAARGGHMDLVLEFIEKGADDMNLGMAAALEGNQKEMDKFFISRGADDAGLRSHAIYARKTCEVYLRHQWKRELPF